ncbi:minor tail protein [Arthrobacter phage Tokki]|nr:minor tail protein [Arthrobacter phage Tokki]
MSPIPDDPNQAQAWISGEAPDQTIDFYIPRGNRGPIGPTGPQGPSLLVGTVETTTGPAVPGTIGPQGLTGPKGDPGGFVIGTDIQGDLNLYTTPGHYRNWTNTAATLANNYPASVVNSTCTLEVMTHAAPGTCIQRLTPVNGTVNVLRSFFMRRWNGTTWTTWNHFSSSRTDQTAGRAIYLWDEINSREQLVYGDTGWRVLTPQNGWTASQLQIRRSGQMVQLLALQVNGAAATTDAISEVLPVGFRANNWPISLRVPITTGTGVITSNVAAVDVSTQALRVFGGNHTLLTAHHIITSWLTNDTWPTTLPGTASGSIPNT